ncbi:HIT domain-containing protein [Ornithinibacillus scapharcae]|uniref:HIT domain-containing protein n=1 Tax=Ornithinibacillus scapharcae TaxID=1147159 RepID=UPI000225ADCC|nr:HIT domain-containing protein [Ornithinibacillus scapharcae]
MTNDFYCDYVLNHKIEVEKVYETENVLAYYHTRPSYKVHIVVIPKKHIPSLTDIHPDDKWILTELMNIIQKVAAKVEQDFGACRVITNLGDYQESKHLHWHIVSGERF